MPALRITTGQSYERVYETYLAVSPKEQVSQSLLQDLTSPKSHTQAIPSGEQKPSGLINSIPDPAQQNPGPYLGREPLGQSFIPGVGPQSPTFKLDLEEAIKLASSSAAVTEQTSAVPPNVNPQINPQISLVSSDFFGAFPSLVTNFLPDRSHPPFKGTSAGNSMGLSSFVPPQIGETGPSTGDALGFFPALLGSGTNASTFNLNSSDPFMNSGSFTELQFGQHGEIGDKKSVLGWNSPIPIDPNKASVHDWNEAPLPSPQQGNSHSQHQSSLLSSKQGWNQNQVQNNTDLSRNNPSQQPKKSSHYGQKQTLVMSQQSQVSSNLNTNTASMINTINTIDSLELPRMLSLIHI